VDSSSQAKASTFDLKGEVYNSVSEAYNQATASKSDFIGGSTL
jgi:hypothetical protein